MSRRMETEPPRLQCDPSADPIARRLVRAAFDDAPSAGKLLAAPGAIAAILAAQPLTQGASAGVTAAITSAARDTSTGRAIASVASKGASAGAASSTAGVTSGFALLPALAKSTLVGLALGGTVLAVGPLVFQSPHDVPSVHAPSARVASSPHIARGSVDVTLPTAGINSRMADDPDPLRASSGRSESAHSSQLMVRAGAKGPSVRPKIAQRETSSSELVSPTKAPFERTASRNHLELNREIALLDSARAALEHQDTSLALKQLEAHAELSERALDPEAVVLRVRALLAAGRHEDAVRTAAAFSRRSPNAPQEKVLRQLLGVTILRDPN